MLNLCSLALVGVSFLVKRLFTARALGEGSPRPRGTGLIIALVFCDAAALFGLITWALTASPLSFYPLVFGFLGMLLHYPRAAREGGIHG